MSRDQIDHLVARLLDDRLDETSRARLEARIARDPELAREITIARKTRELLRKEPLTDLSQGFAARVRARAHFEGPPAARPAPAWPRVAAALLILLGLGIAYEFGRRDGRETVKVETGVPLPVADLDPFSADHARALRVLLADAANITHVPDGLRAPLMNTQLEAFGLREWSAADPGRTGRFVNRLATSLHAGSPRWEVLEEEASQAELWFEVREREARALSPGRTYSLQSTRPLQGEEAVIRLVHRHATNLPSHEQARLAEVVNLKARFVSGQTARVLEDSRVWGRLIQEEPDAAGVTAPVTGVVALALVDAGLDAEAQQFIQAWFPRERVSRQKQVFFEQFPRFGSSAPRSFQVHTEGQGTFRIETDTSGGRIFFRRGSNGQGQER